MRTVRLAEEEMAQAQSGPQFVGSVFVTFSSKEVKLQLLKQLIVFSVISLIALTIGDINLLERGRVCLVCFVLIRSFLTILSHAHIKIGF